MTAKAFTWLDNGCYPGMVLLSCGFTYDEIMGKLKGRRASKWKTGLSEDRELLDRDANAFALYRRIENNSTGEYTKLFYIILPKPFDFSDHSFCVLAHEVLHICQFFLADILDRTKEIEAEAYYHTHIMQQCLDALRAETIRR